jgi:hypothetical protein
MSAQGPWQAVAIICFCLFVVFFNFFLNAWPRLRAWPLVLQDPDRYHRMLSSPLLFRAASADLADRLCVCVCVCVSESVCERESARARQRMSPIVCVCVFSYFYIFSYDVI